jgi:3-hydroxy-9,10-secoandrosta-1,3,5(10)-triene-9,17-dione monooxygenase
MVDRDELLHRAAALVPMLRERAAQTEELRHIPQETVDEFHASGILKASQPARFGGYEIDYPIVLDIAAELGRGCGSSSWCYSIWASHNWLAGMFPEKAQEEYWADSPNVLSSTSFNPTRAKVVATPGGYKLSGHWDFSSGCDAAQWAMLGGMTDDGLRWFLIPRKDYTIEDTWFVSGMRGTGSKDIVMEETFVPEHRAGNVAAMREGQSPGRDLHGSCNYQIPHTSMLSYTLAAPILGIAQGALDEFEGYMADRVNYTSGEKMGENPAVHIRISEAEAEIHSARLIMKNDGDEIFGLIRRGEMPSTAQRARFRRNQAYVARLSTRAVDRLFEGSGGHVLFSNSPMQRFHRDAHAASHHFGIHWETLAEEYGRVRLGLELKNPGRI